MLVIKLTEQPDGSVVAETRREVIATFPNAKKADVARFLRNKAEQTDEELVFVDEFRDQEEERINVHRLMRADR